MNNGNDHFIVKKYANRRLYNTQTSCYVSLADIFDMVKRGENFSVIDVKTDDDITHSVLTQVIFDQESKGLCVLPTDFLRQIIRFYGNSSAPYVTEYLSRSMRYFIDHQEKMQAFMQNAAGVDAAPPFMRQMMDMQAEFLKRAWGGGARAEGFEENAPAEEETADKK